MTQNSLSIYSVKNQSINFSLILSFCNRLRLRWIFFLSKSFFSYSITLSVQHMDVSVTKFINLEFGHFGHRDENFVHDGRQAVRPATGRSLFWHLLSSVPPPPYVALRSLLPLVHLPPSLCWILVFSRVFLPSLFPSDWHSQPLPPSLVINVIVHV